MPSAFNETAIKPNVHPSELGRKTCSPAPHAHITPQFSGRTRPREARRERIMKWRAHAVAATTYHGPRSSDLLDGRFLICPKNRVDSRLIPRPHRPEPFQDIGIETKRDRSLGKHGLKAPSYDDPNDVIHVELWMFGGQLYPCLVILGGAFGRRPPGTHWRCSGRGIRFHAELLV